ncbi:MAG: holo-ACP synthase [Chloroflexota bacterium]
MRYNGRRGVHIETLRHGIDIVEITRIRQAIRRNRAFLNRVFSEAELADNPGAPTLAARFAAKEAAMKMLGSGMFRIGWQDIEITNNKDGSPRIKLTGVALHKAKKLGIKSFSLSLSHSRTYAVASVIGVIQ